MERDANFEAWRMNSGRRVRDARDFTRDVREED